MDQYCNPLETYPGDLRAVELGCACRDRCHFSESLWHPVLSKLDAGQRHCSEGASTRNGAQQPLKFMHALDRVLYREQFCYADGLIICWTYIYVRCNLLSLHSTAAGCDGDGLLRRHAVRTNRFGYDYQHSFSMHTVSKS